MPPHRVLAAAAAVCGEMYADQSPMRWRAEQVESPEYKVLVVGDHGVGKTELIRQFTLSFAANFTSPGHHHHL